MPKLAFFYFLFLFFVGAIFSFFSYQIEKVVPELKVPKDFLFKSGEVSAISFQGLFPTKEADIEFNWLRKKLKLVKKTRPGEENYFLIAEKGGVAKKTVALGEELFFYFGEKGICFDEKGECYLKILSYDGEAVELFFSLKGREPKRIFMALPKMEESVKEVDSSFSFSLLAKAKWFGSDCFLNSQEGRLKFEDQRVLLLKENDVLVFHGGIWKKLQNEKVSGCDIALVSKIKGEIEFLGWDKEENFFKFAISWEEGPFLEDVSLVSARLWGEESVFAKIEGQRVLIKKGAMLVKDRKIWRKVHTDEIFSDRPFPGVALHFYEIKKGEDAVILKGRLFDPWRSHYKEQTFTIAEKKVRKHTTRRERP